MRIRRELLEHDGHLRLGTELLHDPRRNKGTGFTLAERDALRLRGLLPPRVFTEAEQVKRPLENVRRVEDGLQRYIALARCRTATRRCTSARCSTTSPS
jgi:hypothetical protein